MIKVKKTIIFKMNPTNMNLTHRRQKRRGKSLKRSEHQLASLNQMKCADHT